MEYSLRKKSRIARIPNNIVLALAIVSGFFFGLTFAPAFAQSASLAEILQANVQSIAALVTGITALAVAIGKWIDTLRQRGVIDKRWDKGIDIYHKFTNSLEATDRGFGEGMILITKVVDSIAKSPSAQAWAQDPNNKKTLEDLKKFTDDTLTEIKAYYDVIGKMPGAESKDDKVVEMADVETKLVANPVPEDEKVKMFTKDAI